MTRGERILKKKQFIKDELDKRLPRQESDALWRASAERLDDILREYAGIPAGEHTHTDSYIFPSAAIYQTLSGPLGKDEARAVIEEAAISMTTDMGGKLARLMRLPGMPALFVRMWDPISRRMFGERCGFKNVFYPRMKGAYRMDIVACPYQRYFTALDCPELTRIFCENDERTYGSLPGLRFERTQTLGKGGDRCDFLVRRI